MSLIIQGIELSKVNDKDYNTNNHESNLTEEKYLKYTAQTDLCNWINLFPEKQILHVVDFNQYETKILYESTLIGISTGRIPNMYKEELEEIQNKIPKDISNLFFRFEHSSSKDGVGKIGPFKNSKDVIMNIITSKRAMRCLKGQNKSRLYFFEFRKDWKPQNEFRVFVCESKVTAISQYSMYTNFELDKIFDLERLGENIVNFCYLVLSKINLTSVVIDVIVNDNKIELVELNPFGTEYSSGSALFHWIRDHDILYGLTDKVVFRFVN